MSEHDKLLARLDKYGLLDTDAAAAAIRSLQGQLEAERKAREEERRLTDRTYELVLQRAEKAERDRDIYFDRMRAWEIKHSQDCRALQARLAAVFEDTRERCAKVCDKHPGNLVSNNWSSVGVLRDCVKLIRALEPAAACQGTDAISSWEVNPSGAPAAAPTSKSQHKRLVEQGAIEPAADHYEIPAFLRKGTD